MGSRKNLKGAKGGNALIEFALLAPVFFMVVVGLIEFVLYQYKTYALNHVVYHAARNLQTGHVQTSEDMAETFNEEVCKHAKALIGCDDIIFDVRTYSLISDITFPPPVFDEDGNAVNFVFMPGGPNQYSVVRAALPHFFVTPFMDKLFKIGPDQPAIINTFIVVKNEPWT